MWLDMYGTVPENLWISWREKEGTPSQRNLKALAIQLVACWWRTVQLGVDMPPLRCSMVMGINMPNDNVCQVCSDPECKGNQVQLEDISGRLCLSWPHHKASNKQQGPGSGPIHQYPPPGSSTHKLTCALVEKVLPYLHSFMGESLAEVSTAVMLPDIWTARQPGTGMVYEPFSARASSYSKIFQKVCMGSLCFKPHGSGINNLQLVVSPFPWETSQPSDMRRMFITTVQELHDKVTAKLATSTNPEVGDVLKMLAARQVGNKTHMWEEHYDQLIKVREASQMVAFMGALKELLKEVVDKSNIASKLPRKRLLAPNARLLAAKRLREDDEAGPSNVFPPSRAGEVTS